MMQKITALFLSLLWAEAAFAAPLKIGVLLQEYTGPYAEQLVQLFPVVGKTRGAEITVKAPLVSSSTEGQKKILQSWENQGFQALIVSPVAGGEAEIGKELAAWKKNGVVIVSLLTKLPDVTATTFVGVDENSLNDAAIEQCAKLVKDGDEMSILRSNGQLMFTDREKRILVGMRAKYPKLTIHADMFFNSEKGKEIEQSEQALRKYPKSALIYTPYTLASKAMLQALENTGMKGKIKHVAIGSGIVPEAIKALDGNTLQAWIAQFPRDVVTNAVDTTISLVKGGHVAPLVLSQVRVITKENVNSPEIQALNIN